MGRGVLVDYHGWRTSQGAGFRAYDAFESVAIPLADLQACLAAQGTEVKFGDVLFIRSGQSQRHAGGWWGGGLGFGSNVSPVLSS